MIDITKEELVPVEKVPGFVPDRNGRRIHRATVYRWFQRGVRGRRLEWIQVGGRRCTSVQALSRFFNGPDAADGGGEPDRRDDPGGGGPAGAPVPVQPRPSPAPLGARAKAQRQVDERVREAIGAYHTGPSVMACC